MLRSAMSTIKKGKILLRVNILWKLSVLTEEHSLGQGRRSYGKGGE